jgi:hypothetical protein
VGNFSQAFTYLTLLLIALSPHEQTPLRDKIAQGDSDKTLDPTER